MSMDQLWKSGWKLTVVLASLGTVAERAESTEAPLIPRDVIFGNPDRAGVQISPDGKWISYLAPVDGFLNVWIAPVGKLDEARAITDDKVRGIRSYFWAFTNQHILYLQDTGGDENWQVFSVNIETGEKIDLTPIKGVNAQVANVSPKFPNEVLIGLNDRNPQLHDVYRVNITTGKRELLEENEGFADIGTDDDYRLRYAAKFSLIDGSILLYKADGNGGWVEYDKVPMEDTMTTTILGFDKTGENIYALDSRGRNTAALFVVNLESGEKKLLATNDKADVSNLMAHPTEKTIEAVASNYLKTEWEFLDAKVEADFRKLQAIADGELAVSSRTLADDKWIVTFVPDDGPVKYYLFDRKSGETTFLFTNRKELEGLDLAAMHPVVIPSRDGLELVSYLTLPVGTAPEKSMEPTKPLPMVLLVHGGPWGRDSWGLNAMHQWLANRGYAVLSVNFRGSTGFGKNFINAGNREWGAKMHDDLLDAVQWAVDKKIADPSRVAIMGGSYGGYATLVGLTMTPDVFACGVDIVGPSNIITLLKTVPPYWLPQIQVFKDRVGDMSTEEGRKFLESRSPLTHVANIKKPLLIGQGANDPRVKQAESDQIVKAMQEKKIPVTYVLYPDEGHGMQRPENRISFFAITEAFLGEHLGGRVEPIGGDFKGSSLTVPEGASDISGLPQALEAIPKKP